MRRPAMLMFAPAFLVVPSDPDVRMFLGTVMAGIMSGIFLAYISTRR